MLHTLSYMAQSPHGGETWLLSCSTALLLARYTAQSPWQLIQLLLETKQCVTSRQLSTTRLFEFELA